MLSVAALAGALARQTAAAAVPTPLLTSTIHGARLLASGQAGLAEAYSAKVAALTKGVMKSMLLAKLKLAGTALVALGVVGAGAAAVSRLPVHATTSGRILVAEVPPQSAAPVEPRPEPVQQDPPAGRTDQKVTAERTALESRRTLTAEEQAKADEKIAAEYASGRDSGPGHYQSGDQTDKIAAEKAALEKVTAEQRAAAAHQIASSDRK
jgi:hypothetical protein